MNRCICKGNIRVYLIIYVFYLESEQCKNLVWKGSVTDTQKRITLIGKEYI